MNTSNIVAAGKMLAIALILIGIVVCVTTFLYSDEKLEALDQTTKHKLFYSNIVSGLSSIALIMMLPRAPRNRVLANPILIIGIFVLLAGVVPFCIIPRNPLTWIMVFECIPMFITTLCLPSKGEAAVATIWGRSE
jgi:hypothetical protein